MTKVFFFFPYMDESGVPMLFLRMSRWLAEHHGNEFESYVVDYENGAMARNLTEEDKVKIYPYQDDVECCVGDDDIVIFQSFNASFWPQNLKLSAKTKVFWWTLHERCLAPNLIPMPLGELTYKYNFLYKFFAVFYSPFLRGFASMVDDMITHGALYFMDTTTFNMSVKHLPMKTKTICEFLPLPVQDYSGMLKEYRSKHELAKCTNICWLGRLCSEKTPVLKLAIRRFSEFALQNKQRIRMHVLGYGEFQEEVDRLGLECGNEYYHQLKATAIQFKEIDNYLLANVDLMIATGTSALESAKLGVPTVDVDDSFTKSEIKGDYVFKMLSERVDYDLGHDITENDCEAGNKSVEKIMDYLFNHFDVFSKESRLHFEKYHSMTSVGRKFVGLIRQSSYSFDMIPPKVIRPLLSWQLYNRFKGLF